MKWRKPNPNMWAYEDGGLVIWIERHVNYRIGVLYIFKASIRVNNKIIASHVAAHVSDLKSAKQAASTWIKDMNDIAGALK